MAESTSLSSVSALSAPGGALAYSRAANKTQQDAASSGSALEGVRVDISPAARAYARRQGLKTEGESGRAGQLSAEEEAKVKEMARRDREVRAHEQAHVAAGGGLVRGGPNFSYRGGPDGKRYAVSGEVQIDTAPVRDDPDATLQKAMRIRAAALAPADPSAQDRQVAASADKLAQEARQEKQAAG